jgi:hypothetical protein
MLVADVWVVLDDVIRVDKFSGDFADDDDPIGGCNDRPPERREIVARNGKPPPPSLRRSPLRLRFFLGASPRFGMLAPFLGFGPPGSILDEFPPLLQFVIGRIGNLPDLVVSVPAGEGNLPKFVDDGAGIGGADAQTAIVDLQVWAEDRLEREGVATPLLFERGFTVSFRR